MAVKPVDRIRTIITDLERGARTLGDDIRKRAGKVSVTPDIESALRQFLLGLTNIAAQLEKAAGELRRYLEAGAGKSRGRKKAARKTKRPAAKTARKAASKASPAKKSAAKKSSAAVGKTTKPKAAKKKTARK